MWRQIQNNYFFVRGIWRVLVLGFDEFSSFCSASELISACKFEADVKIEPEKVGNKLRLDVEIEATEQ